MTSQLNEQAPAITALVALVETLGHLPTPFISVYTTSTAVELQLSTPGDFEAWREALDAGPDNVRLHAHGGATWLSINVPFRDVTLRLSGHGLPVALGQIYAGPTVAA